MSEFETSSDLALDGSAAHVKRQLERAQVELAELAARRSAEAFAAADELHRNDLAQASMAQRLLRAEAELAAQKAYVEAIHRTRLYRYTERLRRIYFRARTAKRAPDLAGGFVAPPAPAGDDDATYALWIESYDTVDDAARQRLRDQVGALADPPLISVILPIYNTPMRFLHEAIGSVQSQIYPHWELCIVDDCSPDLTLAPAMEALAAQDPRIRFQRRDENGHISVASNSAIALATGTWLAFLDHDDVLAETALALFALRIAEDPDLGVIYSDKDKITEDGRREQPFFKTEFDPLLLMAQNFVCHLALFRKDLVDGVGGFRLGYEGSQDWDLALRVTETLPPRHIAHIPHVLYHWRIHSGSTAGSLSAKSYAADAGERAVRDQLERLRTPGEILPVLSTGWNRVKWTLPDPLPKVSIIVPTRDGLHLNRCLDSLRFRTTYPNLQIIVVDNGSLSYPVLQYLQTHESWVTVQRDDHPFNLADSTNRAVARCDGELVCLLSDDTEVLNVDWLHELVSQVLQPGVGVTGAKLYYPDGRVQHAGYVLGLLGVAGHALRLSDRLSFADQGRMQLPRTYSAVSAACMVVRRQAWDAVGGFDAVDLPSAFTDVDFCLRLVESGWRIVFTPFAELIHHEVPTAGPDLAGHRAPQVQVEERTMHERWGALLRNDPAYNLNLSLADENLPLAWPPRTPSL